MNASKRTIQLAPFYSSSDSFRKEKKQKSNRGPQSRTSPRGGFPTLSLGFGLPSLFLHKIVGFDISTGHFSCTEQNFPADLAFLSGRRLRPVTQLGVAHEPDFICPLGWFSWTSAPTRSLIFRASQPLSSARAPNGCGSVAWLGSGA